MTKIFEADICAIGAGSAGLAVAGRAARMGASAVLIEKGKMGGDCLNYGCVPSKALLAAGRVASLSRRAEQFGAQVGAVHVDGKAVHRHVREVMEAIAPNDSVERFEGFGVKVIRAHARFSGPGEVEADGYRVRARHFVIATGSSPEIPLIRGLTEVPFFTNENIFDKDTLPEHLLVIGGGPTGVEMAQAHRHLGARVTLLEAASILPRDDPEVVEIVRHRLLADDIELLEGAEVISVEKQGSLIIVNVKRDGQVFNRQGTHLLIAVGRRPNTEGLDLGCANVAFSRKGIIVDSRLRTTNKRIYAIGDVIGGYQFAHVCGYHAWVVLRNALLRWPSKVDYHAVPWVTYTSPELAHVGLSEGDARRSKRDIRILRWPFASNDRAQAERETDGLIKVVVTPRGRVLGASIVGSSAGELIHQWVLLVTHRMNVRSLARIIAPYPTFGYACKAAADGFMSPVLFGRGTNYLVRILKQFG